MWLLFLACAADVAEPPAPAPPPAPMVTSSAEPAPAGRIGGEPILVQPVVVGGIANAAVETVVADARSAFVACHTAPGPGKLLLHFAIDQAGVVVDPRLRSTTLRHPETESCVLAVLAGLRFPPLERGAKAIVTWPLDLP